MKVLVTGASGFLGGRLVRWLVADGGHDISILVRPTSDLRDLGETTDLTLVYGDLTDPQSLARATEGIDVVIHSAARVDERGVRAQFVEENVTATTTLLDSARRNGVSRFVFISSPSALMEYDGGDQIDIDESVPYPRRFLNLYSETKAAAEQAVLAANEPGFTTCAPGLARSGARGPVRADRAAARARSGRHPAEPVRRARGVRLAVPRRQHRRRLRQSGHLRQRRRQGLLHRRRRDHQHLAVHG